MPRPDGRLYPSEIAALEPPKVPAKKLGRPPGVARSKEEHGAKIRAVLATQPHPLAPVPNKGGRPMKRIKATPELVNEIVSHVRGGLSLESALVIAGISRSAIEKWKRLNPVVQHKFEKAEAEWEQEMVQNIRGHSVKDMKAAAWLLERRLNARWAAVSKTELTGKDGGPMQVLTIHKQLLERVAKGGDKPVINVTATHAKD